MSIQLENELIDGARNGDAQAVAALYGQHKDKLYRFIHYRVGNAHDAEDLFQEVMIAAFESLERFRAEVPFLHWCYQIARNKIAMFWRAHGKTRVSELHEESEGEEMIFEDSLEEALGGELNEFDEVEEKREEMRERLMAVLDQLPENYSRILKLRFFEEKTLKEAAKEMSISLSNAKVLQHRALKKAVQLAQALSPH